MAKFRLNRRAMLRGAGSVAIALPWLEIMDGSRANAQVAANPAKRFLAVYTPGGSVIDTGIEQPSGINKFRPTGTETAPILSPILAPLEPIKQKLLVLSGLDMSSKKGEQHQAGIIAWLTGTAQLSAPPNGGQPGTNSYASGPSVDQRIATLISKGKKQFSSLEMAVRWGTGKAHGLLSPISCANFEDSEKASPIAPRIDPQQIFDDLFGTPPGGGGNPAKKSILDHVLSEYNALVPKLGTTDRATLEQHVEKLNDIQKGLTAVQNGSATCAVPPRADTDGYNPGSGVCGNNCGPADTVGKFMMDMMVMALACDMTAVGTFQWTDTEAKHTFPWLDLSEHHHFYQHDGIFKPVECEKICTWYSTMHLHLLTEMDRHIMGPDGKTLLDESVVFFGSELSHPSSHGNKDMPFMLAGGGGGLRGGRWLHHGDNSENRNSHNNLLVSILNLFGDPATTFGNPEFCSGPLSNLT
jgi:hypothetical protein